jgi:hypothetical protein
MSDAETPLSQCHFAHNKTPTHWPGPQRKNPATRRLPHSTAVKQSLTTKEEENNKLKKVK